MNMQFRPGEQQGQEAVVKQAIADCDVHPQRRNPKGLYPYLEKYWRDYLDEYGGLSIRAWWSPALSEGQRTLAPRCVPPEAACRARR